LLCFKGLRRFSVSLKIRPLHPLLHLADHVHYGK